MILLDYLKNYIERNRETITDKVTAQNLEIKKDILVKDKNAVFGQLNICPSKTCSASLKENILSKIKKNTEIKCPYCKTKLNESNIQSIKFIFVKI